MIVEVKHVVKSIGTKEIIHNLSFQLERGRTFALLGPNGAGKTTMVRLITGLLKPSKGQIRLFDMEISPKNSDILRQKIGVQNDGNLYEDLTIGQNLDLWGQLYGIESSNIRSKIKEILDFFDLEGRINSKVGQLSKGMRQYEIGVDPKNRATEECKKYGRIYSGSQSETFRLSITEDIHISQIVKHLVESGMAVNTVFEVKHTIKDAYFKIVGGTKSD